MNEKRITLTCVLTLLIALAMFNSCGATSGFGGAGGAGWAARAEAGEDYDHKGRIDKIEKNYQDCLAAAQNAEDKEKCDSIHKQALEEEEDRYSAAKGAIQEKQKCAKYQLWVLNIWGYSEKESNEVVGRLINGKGDEYDYDASEAIGELMMLDYIDKTAVKAFERELPNYGLSINEAERATKQYYEDGLYQKMHCDDKTIISEPYYYKIGEIQVDERLLKCLGLIEDEDGETDNKGDEDEGDNKDNNGTNQGNSNPNPKNQPGDSLSPYQVESKEISNYSVSQYKLDVVKLTSEQKSELVKVIAFMKNWPDVKITVVGHTCSMGSDAVNNKVGMHRAHQAKLYMVSQGIDESRIEEVSKAASEPVNGNDTEKGRLQNRRITFIVK